MMVSETGKAVINFSPLLQRRFDEVCKESVERIELFVTQRRQSSSRSGLLKYELDMLKIVIEARFLQVQKQVFILERHDESNRL